MAGREGAFVSTDTVATPSGAGTAAAGGAADACQPGPAAGPLGGSTAAVAGGAIMAAWPAAGAAGRGRAITSMSLTRSPRATLSRTCWPAVIAVSAADTSSALANGRPFTPRRSSPDAMPAAAAGPDGTSSTIVQRPGVVDSATAMPSHPGTAIGAVAGGGATAAPPAGAAASGAKGSAIGSPIEMSPG